MTGVDLTCIHCRQKRTYLLTGLDLQLFSTDVAILGFFCLSCREENRQRLEHAMAEQLAGIGVPTTLVVIPLEVEERWSSTQGAPPLTETDVVDFEEMAPQVFERLVAQLEGESLG